MRAGAYAVCAILAAGPALAQTPDPPLSPGAVVMLAGRPESEIAPLLQQALLSADPDTRAVAARVIGIAPIPSQARSLLGALAREREDDVGAELARSLLYLRGAEVLSTVTLQAKRLGPATVIVLAEWLARTSPQQFADALPQLLFGIGRASPRLLQLVTLAALQNPSAHAAVLRAWMPIAPEGYWLPVLETVYVPPSNPDEASSVLAEALGSDRSSVRLETALFVALISAAVLRPAMLGRSPDPGGARTFVPVVPSLLTSTLTAFGCDSREDRVAFAVVAYAPTGAPQRIEVNSTGLPQGCAGAVTALARTSIAEPNLPVHEPAGQLIMLPFNPVFIACTAADGQELPVRIGSPGVVAAVLEGRNVRPPQKIHDVRPVYPDVAIRNRIEGVVVVDARISKEGCVSLARITRGVPGLDLAALYAVSRWRYTPTLLDGSPVPVAMTVTVTFTLR